VEREGGVCGGPAVLGVLVVFCGGGGWGLTRAVGMGERREKPGVEC
jgi:hypothetical protein